MTVKHFPCLNEIHQPNPQVIKWEISRNYVILPEHIKVITKDIDYFYLTY